MWVCSADPWHLPYSTVFPTPAMGDGSYRNCGTLPLAKEGKMVSIIAGKFWEVNGVVAYGIPPSKSSPSNQSLLYSILNIKWTCETNLESSFHRTYMCVCARARAFMHARLHAYVRVYVCCLDSNILTDKSRWLWRSFPVEAYELQKMMQLVWAVQSQGSLSSRCQARAADCFRTARWDAKAASIQAMLSWEWGWWLPASSVLFLTGASCSRETSAP